MNKHKKLIEIFLKSRGWSTWYNDNYWIHPKTVSDPEKQDYTNYGMDLQSAFITEVEKVRPLNMMERAGFIEIDANMDRVLELYKEVLE